jgi:hypothetical protein
MGFLQALSEVGLSEADITKAIGESPAIRAEVIRVAEKTRQTWQEVWDEMDHPYQTGAYREAITIRYEEKPSGEFSAVVANKRPEAHWLEYGTVKMAERAPARKTIERMQGELSGATSKKQGGGFAGSVGA